MKRPCALLPAAALLLSTAVLTHCGSSDPYARPSSYPVRSSTYSSSSYYYDSGPYYSTPSYNSSSSYYHGSGYTKPAGVSGGTRYSSESPEEFDAITPPASYSY